MKSFVVDTNVAVTASGRAEQAGPCCVLACIEALDEVRKRGKLLLDDQMLILDEYEKRLSRSGQPGPGDAFMKWAHRNQAVPTHCQKVPIHPKWEDGQSFEEFPDDPDLGGFDRDDRKFVAVAIASRRRPEVLNAVDSDWWLFRQPLARHGVKIEFVCPEQFADRP